MPDATELPARLLPDLTMLYGEHASACAARIAQLADRDGDSQTTNPRSLWNERDAILITYADQVLGADTLPLATLHQFLTEFRLRTLFSTLHILPFFPSSSDDGFAVVDYRAVDPAFGSWRDLLALRGSFDLMYDLVLNHCSAGHRWFQEYLQNRPPGCRYFVEGDPTEDHSLVTRPRESPLLSCFQTAGGERHVWTTFSRDQVDLDWSNPDLLLEMLEILLFYVRRGARIIRLDAIGYLWKQRGTNCIHRPQVHLLVKLMRTLLDSIAPGTLLLTETNVPHAENIRYFGAGDEAHIVYQFSLPPLLLEAFVSGDAQPLQTWLAQLSPPFPGTTYLNFTASHDGIGLRPLEGLLPRKRIGALVDAVCSAGGLVSRRRSADGSSTPYELNASYFSAVNCLPGLSEAMQIRRFLASQAIMLALQGIPAVYFHSLLGTPNDLDGVRQTGRARSINRRRYALSEVQSLLNDAKSAGQRMFGGYYQLLRVRSSQPAFHPDAYQEVIPVAEPSVIALVRTSLDDRQRILVLANVANTPVSVALPAPFSRPRVTELLCLDANWNTPDSLQLSPAGVAWLATGTGP